MILQRNIVFTSIFTTIFVFLLAGGIVNFHRSVQALRAQANPAQTAAPQSALEDGTLAFNVPTPQTANAGESRNETAVLGESAEAVAVNDLFNDISRYLNQNITIRSNISEVVDNRAFRVTTNEEDPTLLLLTYEPYVDERDNILFSEGDEVLATGTLIPFTRDSIEPDFDLRVFDELYAQYEDAYALVIKAANKTTSPRDDE